MAMGSGKCNSLKILGFRSQLDIASQTKLIEKMVSA